VYARLGGGGAQKYAVALAHPRRWAGTPPRKIRARFQNASIHRFYPC
jgi:hypothetical protein